MARRIDYPKGKVFVGHDVTLAIPVVDEVSKAPVDMSSWALQFVVRDTPEGSIRLNKTTAITVTDLDGIGDMALVPITDDDTWDGSAVLFSGKKYYAFRRADANNEVLLQYGDIWFEIVAARA